MDTAPLLEVLRTRGVAADDALRAATERQRSLGGGLDTCLLEVGAVDEAGLLDALAEATGLPPADVGRLLHARSEAVRRLPRPVALRYGVIPFEVDDGAVSVATTGPLDDEALSVIANRLRSEVKLFVAPEVRLSSALALHYLVPLTDRLASLAYNLGVPPVPGSRRALGQSEGDLATDAMTPDVPPRPLSRRSLPVPEDLVAARERLLHAERRDEIVDAVLEYGRSKFACVAAFALAGGRVRGHDALIDDREKDRERVRRIRVSTAWRSVFRTVLETGGHYLGPAPPSELDRLWVADLGRSKVKGILVAPVHLRGRPVLMLYADAGEEPIDPEVAGEWLLLAAAMPTAFERILIERKARSMGIEIDDVEEGAAAEASPGDLEPGDLEPGVVEPAAVEASPGDVEPSDVEPGDVEPGDVESGDVESGDVEASPGDVEAGDVEPAGVEPAVAAALAGAAAEDAARVEGASDVAAAAAALANGPGWDEEIGDGGPAEIEPGEGAAWGEALGGVEPDDVTLADLEDADLAPVEARAVAPVPEPAEVHVVGDDDIVDEAAAPEPEPEPDPFPEAAQVPEPGGAGDDADALETALFLAAKRKPAPAPAADEVDIAHAGESPEAGAAGGDPLRRDVGRLIAGGADSEAALERLVVHGAAAAAALSRVFPGPLRIRAHSVAEMPQDPYAHGPVIAAFARLGGAAREVLCELAVKRGNPTRRLYAVVLLGRAPSTDNLPVLLEALFDPDPMVTVAARDALRSHRGVESYDEAVETLRRDLGLVDQPPRLCDAIRALSHLRDRDAVRRLIQLLGHSDREVVREAQHALTVITKQAFGPSARKWDKWLKANAEKSQYEWLIDGLKHKDRDVRMSAAEDLERLTGESFGYYFDGRPSERAAAIERWEAWWREQ